MAISHETAQRNIAQIRQVREHPNMLGLFTREQAIGIIRDSVANTAEYIHTNNELQGEFCSEVISLLAHANQEGWLSETEQNQIARVTVVPAWGSNPELVLLTFPINNGQQRRNLVTPLVINRDDLLTSASDDPTIHTYLSNHTQEYTSVTDTHSLDTLNAYYTEQTDEIHTVEHLADEQLGYLLGLFTVRAGNIKGRISSHF